MIHLWNLILLDGLLGPVIEESLFRGCLLPVVARTNGPTIGIAATAALFATLHPITARAVALLLGHGDCVWMDPTQIGIYRGIDCDARDIQCNSVLLSSFVDDRGRPAFVQINPRAASVAGTRPL